jgi:hypothetical protein
MHKDAVTVLPKYLTTLLFNDTVNVFFYNILY